MTLNEYVQAVADVTGQRDTTSQNAYVRFVNNRYRMIWDRLDWNDVRTVLQVAVPIGSNTLDLPDYIDRVIRILWDNHALEPVTVGFFFESDPGMYARVGTPQYYEERNNAGVRQVVLYPQPVVAGNPLLEGRKKFQPLAIGTDEPIIRNIDNSLIAYIIGDGYTRQRQNGKAKEKYDEGAMLFGELVKLEKEQTNVPRRTKALTVAGNSLLEMTDDVCARCNDYSPAARIVIKQFLRRQYQMVYDMALWNESLVLCNVGHDGIQCVLPEYVGRVIAARENANTHYSLGVGDLSVYFGMAPQIFEQSNGPIINFSYLASVGVSVLPPQPEKLVIVSTSTFDNGNVFIKGESTGTQVSETIVLNGTTPVLSVNDYDVPLTVSKLATTGDVIVSGNTSLVQLERILASETERKHVRLFLQSNGASGTLLVLAKRRIRPLLQDEDTPLLSDIQNVLIFAASSECYSRQGNAQAAQEAKLKGDAALKVLVDLNTHQGATSPRVIPYTESYEDYADNCEGWFMPKG